MLRRQNEIASQEDNQNVRQENGRLRLEPKELLETGRAPKQEKSPGRKDYPGKIRIPRQVAGSYVIAMGSHDLRGRAVTLIKPIVERPRFRKAARPVHPPTGSAEIICVMVAMDRLLEDAEFTMKRASMRVALPIFRVSQVEGS